MKTDIADNLSGIPNKPGIYQFVDQNGTVIYVGKAKDLKKRLTSYFKGRQTGKTAVMLNKAVALKHVLVENESEALLLENNMIKTLQPRYNILLKDDKTYPWICIKNENFPRIFSTRNIIKDGSSYFGPYTSGLMVKTLLDLIRAIYKIRNCSLNLSDSNIKAGKFKVCLEYHIGSCLAPCVGLQTSGDYLRQVNEIREILKGHISAVIEHLKREMFRLAAELKYEQAQVVKDKIELLSRYKAKSTVVSNTIRNVDVFAYSAENDLAYVNYLKVIEGAVIQAYTLEIKSRLEETRETILGLAVTELRTRFSSDANEILVPFYPDIRLDGIKYSVPKIGDKHKLVQLAEKNALIYRLEQRKRTERQASPDRTTKNLEKLQKDLHMPDLPKHIECFDNSNIMGQNPVASCVVFRNGRPSKKEYRHFNIKTVVGPDDFASMEEVVFRRYRRMLEENTSLPQLIIIDGGKGQLSSAMKSLENLGLKQKVTVIGIAKKLEEIYFPGDSVPIYLDKNSVSLRLIQALRNEAHRFGVTFHRLKRSEGMNKSELDSIKGIGEKTKDLLLKKVGSVEKIKKLPAGKLEDLIGVHKAALISKYLQK